MVVTLIMLADITPEALWHFEAIYAEGPDGSCKVWDSHRLLEFTVSDQPSSLTDSATIKVAGLGDNNLESLRETIRRAGGERGLEL